MLHSLSGCGIRRPKCPKTMEEERERKEGETSLNGSFIAFRNVYWRYWVTVATLSSTGWNPGKCSILVKHGYL